MTSNLVIAVAGSGSIKEAGSLKDCILPVFCTYLQHGILEFSFLLLFFRIGKYIELLIYISFAGQGV